MAAAKKAANTIAQIESEIAVVSHLSCLWGLHTVCGFVFLKSRYKFGILFDPGKYINY